MNADFAKIKKLFFDRARVMTAADRAAVKALSRFGAFVRRRARSGIKAAPKRERTALARGLVRDGSRFVSAPGSPPVSHTGALKDAIYFGYDTSTRSVVIGPVAYKGSGRGALALEEGGPSTRGGRPVTIRARPFMKPAFLAELPGVPAAWRGAVVG